ncbi:MULTISPECIES: ABC transporter permease [unclassified Colwellia]|uniref:ABC transporter permease n=1 Tax=unclassified Colwellia TaxID=196834 RepID=UPI0015F71D26|nr:MULTISPECIES: ABC transporter permease [unclassified Colwellia]MBA6379966.1 ABC transporter permease [Colwellia sp. BRX10-7]MBA6388443.1 ABC transporter permease [Colwellia sp. BRX10-2]MBA6401401.1 ABC transporter permease [Colwellia sp. BRX10-5]MBA6406084.1 ABC transporter permease [Colwellia sp. BRX10-1]
MVILNNLTNEIKLIIATHLAFYRRHPWLMALFFLGFSLGSALLTAISGLNQEANTRYQNSSALINNPVTHLIKPLTGKYFIDGNIWLTLRQHGFINTQPVLRGQLKTNNGETLAIQGVDTLLWLNRAQYQQSDENVNKTAQRFSLSTLLVDSKFANRIVTKTGEPINFSLQNDQHQPEVVLADNIGLWAITDIANADYLLAAKGQLSFIELSHVSEQQLIKIAQLIAGQAQLIDAEQQSFDVLSEAFFFNLTALAMLGYIVAAFLSFNAIKLTLTARQKLIEQMQLLGCIKLSVQLSLVIELIIVSVCTALLGTLGGYLIANALVLDVNSTLVGLYQLDKALVINWQWSNVLLGFTLNISALGVILLAQAKQVAQKSQLMFYSLLVSTLVAVIGLLYYATNEYQALLLCFALLMLFILLVPKVLSLLVSLPLTITNPLTQWLHADTRLHVKDLHIAIIAILVALGSAIGMQIMVKSFSHTLNAHLEKQLSADIYLRSDKLDNTLRQALTNLPEVEKLSIYMQSDGDVNKVPANLASFGNSFEHYQHISLTSGSAINVENFYGQGCLANEQSKIKFNYSLNDVMVFKQNSTKFTCRITGFFYDYGNPRISLLTLEERQKTAALNRDVFGYSIRLKSRTSVAVFSERLMGEFKQDSTKILANKRFKEIANALFEDTFVVTKALNSFILAIALLSLCTSLLSLSVNQLKQLTILRNLGVTQGQLLTMKLLQTAGVVVFTALFAIPLGFALGFALLKFVMPIAFGWTIHFSLDLSSLLITCLTLVGVSVLCAYLPIRKLTNLATKES